jgi:hypothetical protein
MNVLTACAAIIVIGLMFSAACSAVPGGTRQSTGSISTSTAAEPTASARLATGMTATEASALHEQLNTTDLRIEVLGQPDPVDAEHDLTYSISITNHGANPASSTYVDLHLPDGFVMATDSRCGQQQSGVIRCSLGEITAHNASTITATVHVGQVAGQARATFTVGNLFGPDSNETDNTTTIVTEVRGD